MVTADCGSATSNEATLTVVSGPTTCHVDSIVLSTVNGSQGKKYGRATVTIKDNLGNPVSDATVTGDFTGSFSETQSGVTDANGVAVLTTTASVRNPSFTFCVTNVTHATLTYNSNDNVETCDSY